MDIVNYLALESADGVRNSALYIPIYIEIAYFRTIFANLISNITFESRQSSYLKVWIN